jgi:hypothetical protein
MGLLGVDLQPVQVAVAAQQAEGRSVSYLARADEAGALQLAGWLAFGDRAKAGAAEAIATLATQGVRSVLISGDNAGAARHLASELGITEVHAEVLPADKARLVGTLREGLDAIALTRAAAERGITVAPISRFGLEPVARLLGEGAAGFFDVDLAEEGRRRLRRASRDGRPLGAGDWVKALEATTGRVLAAPRRGRPPLKGDTHAFAGE